VNKKEPDKGSCKEDAKKEEIRQQEQSKLSSQLLVVE